MILGLCCAKDAECMIGEVLRSHLQVCDAVLLLDDGSTDRTFDIADSFLDVNAIRQEALPRNEARDRNWLFAHAHAYQPDWCFWFDADEILYQGKPEDILHVEPSINTCATRLLDLWGDETHYAHDWSIQKRHVFRYLPVLCWGYQWRGRGKQSLHCGGRPRLPEYQDDERIGGVPIIELHYGYIDRGTVNKRLDYYRDNDPGFRGFKPYRRFERDPQDVRPIAEAVDQ